MAAAAARRLAADPSRAVADEEVVPGALLVADISGFTRLAERLAQQGAIGAEELFRLLNGVFGRLADVVRDHGGEIVGFAGDAVIALWTADGDGLGAAARAATACGIAACAEVAAFPAPEPGGLSLRAAVGAGDVRLPLVGGVDRRWLFLALGPALTQLRPALRRARAGEVVLSTEAWSLGNFLGAPLGDGLWRVEAIHGAAWFPPAPAPLAVAGDGLLEALAPPAILARLGVVGNPWWAELRQVSCVFVGLLGEAAPSLEVLDGFARVLQETAARFEATLKELSADDKGVVGILVFGLAPLAHEDDARRAVLAALDIRSRFAPANQQCSVGVASGRAFCGAIETSTRSDYTVIGDPMNLAARLMQAAKDGILCDDGTHQLARRVEYERRAVIPAKGKADPVVVWSPLGAAGDDVPEPAPMVGREPELARLAARLEALASGTAGVVVVEGEAGIGKSRLVSELVRMAEARGITAAIAAADPIDRGSPYHPWRRILAALCGPELLADATALHSWLRERLPTARDAELMPLLDTVLPLGVDDNATTREMGGAARAECTNALVVRLLAHDHGPRGRPLVVVLDDAQWLDSASWVLAERVARESPVLVVVSKRPWEVPDPPPEASFIDEEGVERLLLEGLAPDEVATLVVNRVSAGAMSASVRDFIVERADGNPFFSEEIAYALRDTGLGVVTGGVFREAGAPGDLQAQALPHTLEAVIMSRLDRLPAPVQLTLKVASIAGLTFSVRLLEAVHPVAADRERVPSHLETLARLDFVVPEPGLPEPSYSFKHATVRDAAYNVLLFAQRRELHAAVAEWLEGRETDDAVRRYAVLAHHWRHADVAEKAAQNLSLAGEHSLRSGSYPEAVGFLEDALAAGAGIDRVRRARWERWIGEALLGMGRQVDARAHLRRAVALAGWPEPRSRLRLVLRLLSQVAVQVLARVGMRRIFFRTRASGEQNAEAAAGFVRLVETYWLSDDSLPLVYAAVAGLNVAERGGPSPDLARAYAIVCMASGSVPLHRLARMYARRALDTAESLGQLEPLAYCSLMTSVYSLGVGEWHVARERLERARQIFENLGDRRFAAYACALLGMAANDEGDFDRGMDLFTEVYTLGERHGSVQAQLWGLTGQALASARKGRPDPALRLLQAARTLVSDDLDPIEVLRLEAALALVHLRRGDLALALESTTAGWKAAQSRRSVAAVSLLQPYWILSDTSLALWERTNDPAARDLARHVAHELRRYTRLFPIGRPRAWVNKGVARWLLGRRSAARRSWRAGLRAAERLHMPYDAARAHYEIGRHLPEGDPTRRLHLEQAADLFARLGAEDDAARAAGALATTAA